MVEAVRVGTLVAHNRKAADQWRRARDRKAIKSQRRLVGAELEAAVMRVADMFPTNVVHGAA